MYLINSCFTERTGTSSCTVLHEGKMYTGFAKLHPDDADKVSRFAGCEIAETRAEIKALKAELKKEREKCEEVRKFVIACSQYTKWNKDDSSAKAVYRQLNRRIKRVNKLVDMINEKELKIMRLIGQRDAVIKAINRHKAKNN